MGQGRTSPASLAGKKVSDMMFIMPLQDNSCLSINCNSHLGHYSIAVLVDSERIYNPTILCQGFNRAFDQLETEGIGRRYDDIPSVKKLNKASAPHILHNIERESLRKYNKLVDSQVLDLRGSMVRKYEADKLERMEAKQREEEGRRRMERIVFEEEKLRREAVSE
jgi:hypothetical protein